jgi:hypothetical protein
MESKSETGRDRTELIGVVGYRCCGAVIGTIRIVWESARDLLVCAMCSVWGVFKLINRSTTTLALITPMATEQTRRRIPKFPFRVLVIGRANAGKTTILQRICETTQSPTVYRGWGDEEVRSPSFCLKI